MNIGSLLIWTGGIAALYAALAIPYGFYFKQSEAPISVPKVNIQGSNLHSSPVIVDSPGAKVITSDPKEDRSLSSKQLNQLIALLEKIGKNKIEIQSNPDRESVSLRNALGLAFKSAGWEVNQTAALIARDIKGLIFNNDKSMADIISPIGQIFLNFGWSATGAQYQDNDQGRIVLYVGSN